VGEVVVEPAPAHADVLVGVPVGVGDVVTHLVLVRVVPARQERIGAAAVDDAAVAPAAPALLLALEDRRLVVGDAQGFRDAIISIVTEPDPVNFILIALEVVRREQRKQCKKGC